VERKRKVGVVLFQLGGPDSPEAVEPFLYNLFCDPDILDLPLGALMRKPLAKWISLRRARKAAEHYAEIGGGSPIGLLTERQARALEQALAPHLEARVVVAMRYWKPFTADAVAALEPLPLEEIILLPLYPQYSRATTGSSLNEWKRRYRDRGIPVRLVEHYCDHPLLVEAFVRKINTALGHFRRGDNVHLIFSAHSLPISFVQRGDPYPRQVETTTRLVMERGGWPNAHTLCYQSKVGRQHWLEPSLHDTIEQLARRGSKHLLVVPISFVTEHVETLHEINIEAREQARQAGVEKFAMMPALNSSPEFIACLADLVLRAAGAEQVSSTRAQAAGSRCASTKGCESA